MNLTTRKITVEFDYSKIEVRVLAHLLRSEIESDWSPSGMGAWVSTMRLGCDRKILERMAELGMLETNRKGNPYEWWHLTRLGKQVAESLKRDPYEPSRRCRLQQWWRGLVGAFFGNRS